ncbi:MAG TPA: LysR substrate-binding domain-containing protein [Acidimicrobiia bacterium]|nr:LysR substrate-binding domain-containing protein [Acidimicrobiia bacterium]
MNLNQVQIFCAVAKHLSFSMAAEELFITQPAVSQQVKALERQLNVKVFERVGHKLFLTEAGEAALPHFQAMLTARAEMEQTLAMLRGSGRLAVGANTTGGMYVAPAIIRSFRDISPEVEATLQIETTNRILDRVMQNMIDVAIVTGPVQDGRFAIRDLCSDEVTLIVSPSHPFAGRSSVSPAEVANEAFAVPEPGSRTRTLIEEAFLTRGHRLRVTMQLPGTEAVKKAVEANLAVAMVSRYAIPREVSLGALTRVSIDGLVIDRPIHILHRKGKHLSPLVRRFLAFAVEHAAEAEGILKRIRK